MIGQEKLLSRFDFSDSAKLPHSILFLGEEGCGKRTLAKELAGRFGLEFVEMEEGVEAEKLIEYRQSPIKRAYFLEIGKVQEKRQNRFLKFIEEPGDDAYVFLSAVSEIGLLPTVTARCSVYRFEEYSEEELRQAKPGLPELAYSICRTPGQLAQVDGKSLEPMKRDCEKLIHEMKSARHAAVLGYASKLNYRENYDKYDFGCFFRMLEKTAFDDYIGNGDEDGYKIYRFTAEFMKRLSYGAISKEAFALSYFGRLQEVLGYGKAS